MINLLPPSEKRSILRFYRFRLGVVILLFFGGLLLIINILLIPSLIIAIAKARLIEERVETVQGQLNNKRGFSVDEEVSLVNQKLNILIEPGVKGPAIASAIVYAVQKKPKGVSVDHIFIDREADGKVKLLLTGVSSNRDALISFATLLKKDGYYSRVELPLTSLAKSEQIPFSLILYSK